MREIPVYMIVGFLDAGKTDFINGILEEGFAQGERTVLISCEEGEIEYNEKALEGVNVVQVEEYEQLTAKFLRELEKKYKPTQILMEYNGMWGMEELCTYRFPGNWTLYQIMCIVDATTFELYTKNMGKLMLEKLRNADMIAFNRCTDELKVSLRKRNLRMLNRRADIFLEDTAGNAEDYRDGTVSAFDLSQELIDITDEDYGIFFTEVMDDLPMYEGKKVRFRGIVSQDERFGQYYVAGRHVMVCCADDIAFFGLPCKGLGKDTLKTRDWAILTGTIRSFQWELYGDEPGPLLEVESVVPCEKPEQELVQF